MWTTRQRFFIIAGVSAGIILAAVLLFFFFSDNGSQSVEEENTLKDTTKNEVQTIPGALSIDQETLVNTQAKPVTDDMSAAHVARLFVERYGSFSNQNNNRHIDDVLPFATDSMKEWLRTQTVPRGGAYEGMTTKVVASSLKNFDNKSATIQVDTQRERRINGSSDVVYQSARVLLVKEGSAWKVDGLFWE